MPRSGSGVVVAWVVVGSSVVVLIGEVLDGVVEMLVEEPGLDVVVGISVVVESTGEEEVSGVVEGLSLGVVGVVGPVGFALQLASEASMHWRSSGLNSSPAGQSKAAAMGRSH